MGGNFCKIKIFRFSKKTFASCFAQPKQEVFFMIDKLVIQKGLHGYYRCFVRYLIFKHMYRVVNL